MPNVLSFQYLFRDINLEKKIMQVTPEMICFILEQVFFFKCSTICEVNSGLPLARKRVPLGFYIFSLRITFRVGYLQNLLEKIKKVVLL